jgi:hypothetical protein
MSKRRSGLNFQRSSYNVCCNKTNQTQIIYETVPSAPIELLVFNITATTINISFTQESNGGLTITNYRYSLNESAFIYCNPAKLTSPITIFGLEPVTSYTITLQAINNLGNSESSSPVFVTTISSIPPAPISVSAANISETSVDISFAQDSDGGSTITNYRYGFITNANSVQSPIRISGLLPETNYTIMLQALNNIGNSFFSSPISITTTADFPSPPTSLSIFNNTGTTVDISFNQFSDEGSAITNYRYALNGETSFTELNPAVTSSPITISALLPATNYSLLLQAINSFGNSFLDSPISFTTIANAPPAPTSLIVSNNFRTTIDISFTQGSNGGSAITNYSFSLDGGSFTPLNPANATSPITITGLTAATTYSIVLKAINNIGSSPSSALLSATTASFETNGLVIFLDAANINSYNPSTPNIWKSLIDNSYDYTLYNSPTSTSNSIVFNNSLNQYGECATAFSSSIWSIELWAFNNNNTNTNLCCLFTNIQTNNSNISYYVWDGGSQLLCGYFSQQTFKLTQTPNITNQQWTHITACFNGSEINCYYNGILQQTVYCGFWFPTIYGSRLMNTWATGPSCYNGSLGIVRVYDRDLNASEVLNNFNSEKIRYI